MERLWYDQTSLRWDDRYASLVFHQGWNIWHNMYGCAESAWFKKMICFGCAVYVCVCTLCVLAPPTGQLLHKLPRMKHEYNTECKVQTLDNRWVVSIQAGSPGFSFRPPECDWGKKNLKSQVKRCFSLSSNVCCFYTIIYFTLSRKWESADEAQHDAVVLKGGFLEFLSQDGGAGLNKPMWLLRVCSQVDPPLRHPAPVTFL